MKQIKAHIAVSLDGHTATLDQELDWLPDEVKTIIGKHYMVVDSLLMGANTYNYIFEHWRMEVSYENVLCCKLR